MIEFTVDFSGLDALRERVSPALDRGAVAMAAVVGEAAKRGVPVDTGGLKRSGRLVKGKPGKHEAAVRYGDNKAVRYARFVHDGTERHRSVPFLRDALTGEAARAVKAGADVVKRELER